MVGVDRIDGGPRDLCRCGHRRIVDRIVLTRPRGVEVTVVDRTGVAAGASWGKRSNAWLGARPIIPDGRPLIGEVSPGVYVAGGQGMWRLAHGPVTGRLLAEQITTAKQPQALPEFDPLRTSGR